ncbi:hypothetical protein KQH40_00605 [bacterium]|nr:hypothetical protein [bacterium]
MSRKVSLTDQSVTQSSSPVPATSPVGEVASRPVAERIIYVPVNNVFPDPDQPRTPLLPFGEASGFLRERFIGMEIDCFQAAKEWMALSRHDQAHTRRVQFLLDMAAGFAAEDGGQINPVTVVRMEEPRGAYLIETGEQRFWSTVLGYVNSGMKGDVPTLKVVVKPEFSRKRQVLENRHVGPPSVVSQAREIATLFISEGLLEVPEELADLHPSRRDPFAIHRWVAETRKPHGSWKVLEEIMSMSDANMQKILRLVMLPTHLLAIADRYNLSLRTLEAIISQPEALWPELVDLAVHEDWTGADFQEAEIVDEAPEEKPKKRMRDAHQQALSNVKGFVRTLGRTTEDIELVIGQVADELAILKDEEALASYDYLSSLTEQIRLRLIEKGLLE